MKIDKTKWAECLRALRYANECRKAHHGFIRWADDNNGTQSVYKRISSGACEDWPAGHKYDARMLAQAATEALDDAFAKRPKYSRVATVRKLWQEMTK